MATTFRLTDEDADIVGYLRAKITDRSDACSLVRSVTNTAAGPTAGIAITRTAGGTELKWITDPLDGTDLTAAAWEFHLWAKESNAAANAALRFKVTKYTTAGEAATDALDDNNGTELGTTTQDYNRTTGVATITTMADGDRLVFKVLVEDAGTLVTGHTVTVAYNGQYPKAEGDSYVICPDTIAATAAIPTTTRDVVRRHLKDTDSTNPFITTAEIDDSINQALKTYSDDRPRLVADLYSGDGSMFLFRMPRLWIMGFSTLGEIEYPYDTAQQIPTVLERNDVVMEEAVLGNQPIRRLRFRSGTPSNATDNVLVRYTTRHIHNDELDTVPTTDFEPVTWLAAAYAASKASGRMAASSDPTISADGVSYRTGRSEWEAVAKANFAKYSDHIRQKDAGAPVGTIRDWDTQLTPGSDFLFHRRRLR